MFVMFSNMCLKGLFCVLNNRFIVVKGVIKVEGYSFDVIDRFEKLYGEIF